MELYLTYHKVLDKLQQFQENYCCLNSFGYGNLVDFGKNVSGQTIQYPYLYVVPQAITYDQNTTTYQLSCIFADRLNESMDNEKDAVSDMSLAARQLLSEIWRGNLQDYFDAQLPVNAQPFMERFNDYVAGVALDLNVTVMEDINACEQWIITPFPSPTMTPSPTVTPTPSVTPGFTPPVTPSPTATPSMTPSPVVPIDPNSLGAIWWLDYTDSSYLTLNGGKVERATNRTGNPDFYSVEPANGPLWTSNAYAGISGATSPTSSGLSSLLGDYPTSISAYTHFVVFRGDVNSYCNRITDSDNNLDYSGNTQGYRWFSLNDYTAAPPDTIRTYTFYTDGSSVGPEPDYVYSAGTWLFVAVRVYQNGSNANTEIWISNVMVDNTIQTNTILTATNPIFNVVGNGDAQAYIAEQFFFDKKLTDSEMASAFGYLNTKY